MILNNNYRSPFFIAVGVHLLLFVLLFIHFATTPPAQLSGQSTNIIKAVTVDQNQLAREMQPPAPTSPSSPLPSPQQVASPTAPTPSPVVPPVVSQPPPATPPPTQPTQQQLQQAALLKQQQAAAQLVQQQEQAQQQKQQEQAQAQQELAKQQAAQQAATQQVQELAAAQQLKQQQKKQAAMRKKLIAQEIQQQLATQQTQVTAKQQAKTKQQQLQAAKLATQQLLQQEVSTSENDNASTSDNSATSATQTAVDQSQVDKYAALIQQVISQQWNVPDDVQKDQIGKLLVRLAPGGVVLSVDIIQSSGNLALDRSARIAVLKASPLPVPSDPALFAKFRELRLTVEPQGIIAGT